MEIPIINKVDSLEIHTNINMSNIIYKFYVYGAYDDSCLTRNRQ